MLVSGGQQRYIIMHIYISILPQSPLQFRRAHDIEQSSLCCTYVVVGHHLKYSSAYTSTPNSLTVPSPQPSPSNHKLILQVGESASMQISSFASFLFNSTYKRRHTIFLLLHLTDCIQDVEVRVLCSLTDTILQILAHCEAALQFVQTR